ncbi:uncharacterized protein LOC142182080 [Nicotiana tabacum]|uniref:Uncharacterized protein LOC142182080 n=1 Tax=Nicotiana tabacum TaxID=4097 RepID=A0AC58URI2_TOBAC
MNTVSSNLLGGMVYIDSAQDVWEDLKERFNKVDGSRSFSLHQEIVRLTQGTASVATYFTKLKELWVELEALVPPPGCKCDKSRKFVAYLQRQKLYQFLMELNDNYLQARSRILLMTLLPLVNQVYTMIVSDESQKAMGALPNGEVSQVAHIGSSTISDNSTLTNVFLVPQFKYNIMSVSQDLCNGKVKDIGKECDGLYLLLNNSTGKLGETGLNVHQAIVVSAKEIKLCKKPSLNHLRVMRCLCYAKNIAETDKLQPRTRTTILMGYSEGSFSSITEPQSYTEAAQDPAWIEAIQAEINALQENNTWEIVSLPEGKKPIGCKCIYKVKYKATGEAERLKARLVAKGYSQQEGDRLDLIEDTKNALQKAFKMKDLGELKYFLRIEFAISEKGISLHQRKYALELVSELGLSTAKPIGTPMDNNLKLTTREYDEHLSTASLAGDEQPKRSHMKAAQRIVKYIKNEHGLGVLLSNKPQDKITAFCDADWAACPQTRKSITGFLVKIGESTVS